MLTIIYNFMAFVSRYYRFRLVDREPSENRVSVFRTELLICMDDYKMNINIDPEDAQELSILTHIFRAIIKNASPVPRIPADGALVT